MSAPICHRGHARCPRCVGCQTCFDLGDLGEWGCTCRSGQPGLSPPNNVVSLSAYVAMRNTCRVDLDDTIADLLSAAAQMGALTKATGASWELQQEAAEGARRVLETVRWLEANRAAWRCRAEAARAKRRGGEGPGGA